MVFNVGVYVDGWFILFFFKVWINVVLLKWVGGWVKCCFGLILIDLIMLFFINLGKIFFLFFLLLLWFLIYICINFLNFILELLVINVMLFCWSVIFMVFKIVGVIWLVIKCD